MSDVGRKVGSHRRAPGAPPPVEQPSASTQATTTAVATSAVAAPTPAIIKEPTIETRETRSSTLHNTIFYSPNIYSLLVRGCRGKSASSKT